MGWTKRFFFNGPGYHSQIGPYYGKGMDWTSVMGWIQESEAAFGRILFFEGQASNPNPKASKQNLNSWMERIGPYYWIGMDRTSGMDWNKTEL